jgi:phosphatidylinositol glycan class M
MRRGVKVVKLKELNKATESKPVKTNYILIAIILSIIVRAITLVIGDYVDKTSRVKFTDIDYKVFTDAAEFVVNGYSPYLRATYRYTPLLSWLLTFNHVLSPLFGKIVFCICDIVTGYVLLLLNRHYGCDEKTSFITVLFIWLLNPMVFVVSCRGNAESVICCLVVVTLYLMEKRALLLGSVFFGLSVHMKIYPIIYVLPLLLRFRRLQFQQDGLWAKFKRQFTFERLFFAFVSFGTFLGLFIWMYRW